jgi:hypothetical protein
MTIGMEATGAAWSGNRLGRSIVRLQGVRFIAGAPNRVTFAIFGKQGIHIIATTVAKVVADGADFY